jgi:hypothetical protein
MLYFIGTWFILAIACGILGITIFNRTTYLKDNSNESVLETGDRWLLAEWLGLVVLAIILLAVSLFSPLSSWVGVMVTEILCGLALCFKRTRVEVRQYWRSLSKLKLLGMVLGMSAIASITTQQVTWNDTGLYHYSLIQWLAQYGTVPGIALLFENLGFTSTWFALAAPLNPEILQSRVSAVTNGFIDWLALCHIWTGVKQIWSGKAKLSDWFMSGFFGLILAVTLGGSGMRLLYVSPTPDLPVMMLAGLVGWVILLSGQILLKQHQDSLSRISLILALGAVSIKLTALPLLGISTLFLLLRKPLKIYNFLALFGLTSLLLSPFLVSSIFTSGCPLYPSSLFCLNLPWSPATEAIQSVGDSTHGWLSWYGTPPGGINPWLWALSKWWQTDRANQIMGISILVSIAIAPYPLILSWRRRSSALLWLVILAVTGIGFFMLKAPFTRFALPYILIIPTLAIALLGQGLLTSGRVSAEKSIEIWIGTKGGRSMAQTIFLVLIVLLLVRQTSQGGALLLPPRLPAVTVKQRQVNDILYSSPGENLCWATPIPCAFEVPPDVRLRNPEGSFGDGFVR